MAEPADTERERRRQRIYATIRDVPPGRVASYGQIAELAGIPRGARQVGRALRELPKDSDVPWFRILTASGHLAFEHGSRSWKRQVAALAAEEVVLTNGKVNLAVYRWEPDLDELLWKPSAAWD
jgi:methylated-DNA-protein-cysteine methyltransferase related protein